MSQSLLDLRPKILHFSGHGTAGGELCFEDVTGKFADCASYGGFDAAAIAAVVDKVRALGSLSDVRELTASLRRPAKEEKGFE